MTAAVWTWVWLALAILALIFGTTEGAATALVVSAVWNATAYLERRTG